jgi:hypothetical protein
MLVLNERVDVINVVTRPLECLHPTIGCGMAAVVISRNGETLSG